jgi:hypothetical protein
VEKRNKRLSTIFMMIVFSLRFIRPVIAISALYWETAAAAQPRRLIPVMCIRRAGSKPASADRRLGVGRRRVFHSDSKELAGFFSLPSHLLA